MEGLLSLSRFLDQHVEPAALLGPDGEQTPLPMEVYEVLVRVVEAMRAQRAVTIAPVEQKLTTQQAADLLGISRPTLVKVIERGELPCERPSGSRHRRIRLSDLLGYQNRLAQQQDDALADLVRGAEEDGLYTLPAGELAAAIRSMRAGSEQVITPTRPRRH